MQPHLFANAKLVCNADSTSFGVDPRSPKFKVSFGSPDKMLKQRSWRPATLPYLLTTSDLEERLAEGFCYTFYCAKVRDPL